VNFLSHFGLLLECRNNRLLDGVTLLSIPAQAASALVLSVNTVTGGTQIGSIFAEFPYCTRPAGVQLEVRHNTPSHPDYTWPSGHLPTTATGTGSAPYCQSRVRRHVAGWHSSPLREFLVFGTPHLTKDNGWRPCGDYRALNSLTMPDLYLVRNIHDYSHQLFCCSIFSKIDLVRAHNQIPVHPDDIQKTAITTPFGLFEFPFMSFGFHNGAQTFQRSMDDILRVLDFTYLDDILIFSRTLE
jgi:hypothetical protein